MAKARTPRQRWVDEGLRMLEDGGPEAVRVEALAKNLGVTKGGFYGHFGDRQALLDAMLDTWESRSVDDVIAQVEREAGNSRTRAVRARELTFSEDLLPVDLAVREWSRRDDAVAERLHRVDARRIDLLRDLMGSRFDDPIDVEARSTLAMLATIGAHFVSIAHGSLDGAEVKSRVTDILMGDER